MEYLNNLRISMHILHPECTPTDVEKEFKYLEGSNEEGVRVS
jgi:hypothetical protein